MSSKLKVGASAVQTRLLRLLATVHGFAAKVFASAISTKPSGTAAAAVELGRALEAGISGHTRT